MKYFDLRSDVQNNYKNTPQKAESNVLYYEKSFYYKYSALFLLLIFIFCISLISVFNFSTPISNASLTPPNTASVSLCGLRKISDSTVPASAKPTNAVIKAVDGASETPNFAIAQFRFFYGATAEDNRIYALSSGPKIRIYKASDYSFVKSFTVANSNGTFAVDPDGNVYTANTSAHLYKYDTDGNQLWSASTTGPIDSGVYGYNTTDGFRIGTVVRGLNGSNTFLTDGTRQSNNNVIGSLIEQNHATGDIIATGSGYVRTFTSDGLTQKLYFGTNLGAHDPGPLHFYILGGADYLSDGTIAVADSGRGLRLFDNTGLYLGMAKNGGSLDGGVAGYITESSSVIFYDGKIFYKTGSSFNTPQDISYMSEDNYKAFIDYPQGYPFTLGIGAGPFTNVKGNYFPYGTTPQVYLQFYPWWKIHAGSLSGDYTIRTIQQIKDNQSVTPISFTVPSSDSIANISLNLPSTDPGFYELEVKLYKNGQVIGADCLDYSIGAQNNSLDLAELPTGTNARAITLAYKTGQKLLRASFSIDPLLPSDADSTDPLNFTSYDADIQAAGTLADSLGFTFEIQVATGSAKEKAIVANGRWQDRVTELVNHYKDYVHAWEAWNEPNNTYGSAANFTNNILKPFYNGVKAADPTATVVGGGILGVSESYWTTIGDNGGFDYMDVAGDHPYTGHNRSFEEQGIIANLQNLQTIFAAHGKPNMEIWDTESGFWNSGTSSYYNQGDKLVRKVIWENSIGITRYSNFFNEGGYMVDGLYWALYNNTTLTPGGLAMSNMGTILSKRTFENFIATNIPHTYVAVYGKESGSAVDDKVAVIWADDFTENIQLSMPNSDSFSIIDTWGKTIEYYAYQGVMNLAINGSPQYIKIPTGKQLNIQSVEDFGQNISLASQGASATATTQLTVNSASKAIDGIMNTQNKGGNTEGISVWIQKPADSAPELTIDLGQSRILDRILVSSQGLGSVQTGLRDYDIQLKNGEEAWQTIASIRNDFFARNHLLSFNAQSATQIKLVVISVNYSGYAGGIQPTFWPTDPVELAKEDVWAGQASVYEVEAYSPNTTHALPVPPSNDNPNDNSIEPNIISNSDTTNNISSTAKKNTSSTIARIQTDTFDNSVSTNSEQNQISSRTPEPESPNITPVSSTSSKNNDDKSYPWVKVLILSTGGASLAGSIVIGLRMLLKF